MPFVRVVPVLRTPVGVDAFDYLLPEGMRPQRGDLLVVPFRGRPTPALVVDLLDESPFAKKAAKVSGTYADLRLGSAIVELLRWTADRTLTSRPSVLKAWLRHLPKKPKGTRVLTGRADSGRRRMGSLRAHWVMATESHLVKRAKTLALQNKRVLVLTPWRVRAERLLSILTPSSPDPSSGRRGTTPHSSILHGDLSDGDAFEAWASFVNGSTRLLSATRLGAWLAPLADVVLIDEPENDDHKQDELAPRYDARLLAAWAAAHAGTDVESYGRTPPLHVRTAAPDIPVPLGVHVRHPAGRSAIPMIQADTLHALRMHEGPRLIIHPIRGVAARYACRECGWRAVCPRCGFPLAAEATRAICRQCGWKGDPPLVCARCGSADLGKALPGIARLRAAWEKNEPETPIEWRGLSNEEMEREIPAGALIVVTDGTLLGGAAEDVRRRERTAISFRRLADRILAAGGRLLIQSDEKSAGDYSSWLTTEGFAAFQERERRERGLFGYPPMHRLVKVLTRDAGELPDLPHVRERRGPFPVAFRSLAQEPRHVWHLLYDPGISETALIRSLAPLAKRAIIDLDPIAFFR